jgi:hypothetical protein
MAAVGLPPATPMIEPLRRYLGPFQGVARLGPSRASGSAPLTQGGEDVQAVLQLGPMLLTKPGSHRFNPLAQTRAAVEDLQVADEWLVIQIRRSKTDQTGKGRKIGIPYGTVPLTCPVNATFEWVKKADIKSGPLFRGVSKHGRLSRARLTDQVVWGIVKKYAKVAGMNPSAFGAHSLRAGLVTPGHDRRCQ